MSSTGTGEGMEWATGVLRSAPVFAKAENVLADVGRYFGGYLAIRRREREVHSTYAMDLSHAPSSFRSVVINVGTRSDRVGESLVHELLHLDIASKGALHVAALDLVGPQEHFGSDFGDMVQKFGNLLDHEQFFDSYAAMGLAPDRFLTASAPEPDYVDLARRCKADNEARRVVPMQRSWWFLEYFRHRISVRHGARGAADAAEVVRISGSTVITDFGVKTAEVDSLISKGAFRTAASTVATLPRLYAIAGMPRITKCYYLQKRQNGAIELRQVNVT